MPWILNFKTGVLNGVFEFQEFIGDHFVVDVKRNGDHFGVDLRGVDLRIISGWGSFRGLYILSGSLLKYCTILPVSRAGHQITQIKYHFELF